MCSIDIYCQKVRLLTWYRGEDELCEESMGANGQRNSVVREKMSFPTGKPKTLSLLRGAKFHLTKCHIFCGQEKSVM